MTIALVTKTAAAVLLATVSLATNANAQSSLSIPRPDPEFKGKIGETLKDSIPSYPPPLKAPQGAPNVLIILLDDVGFGHTSTFGGPVPTPTLDRLGKNGLMYNTFHTTALCSPTRAALLTGRNHHSVGTGVIIELGTGFPGYTGIIPQSAAMIPEILRDNGYVTAMFGKAHNTPEMEISPAGPFNHWPTGQGFDYFYGFNQGETSQWFPVLYRNTTAVAQPRSPEQGYHFVADMTDETIAWIANTRAADKAKPWFVYYSSPAAHAPHHTPKEWIDKFKGKFDYGWDKQREITFAEQKKLGVVPQNTKLTPRPKEIPAWDDQPAEAKRVYTRLMENYAGYLAYADDQIGRLIDSIEKAGELDNTLIFYIVGDNGPSAEGGWKERSARSLAWLDTTLDCPPLSNGSTRSAGRSLNRTFRWVGRGRWRLRCNGQSKSPATSAARATRWWSTGLTVSRPRANCARNSTMSSTSCRRSWKRRTSPRRASSTGSRRSRLRASA
jgi:arylsulfatase A-like enzyme